MTWARLDDSFWRNPKVIGCSDAALGLYVRAIAYCADQRTDGELTGMALKMLRAKVGMVRELVAAGLLDDLCDRYMVHDFLKYNPSRADLQKKVVAGQAGGQASAQARAQAKGQAVPVPVPQRDHDDVDRARVFGLYEGMGWTIAPNMIDRLVNMESEHPPDWLDDAFRAAAEARARNLNYIEAILKHWREHGRDCECRKPVSRAPGQAVSPRNGAADPAAITRRLEERRRAAGL